MAGSISGGPGSGSGSAQVNSEDGMKAYKAVVRYVGDICLCP